MKVKFLLMLVITLTVTACSTTSYNGSKYQYVQEKVTWHQAKALAEQRGGHLAILDTEDELSFLQSSFGYKTIAWVGLTDQKVEGDWRWIDGKKINPVMIGLLQQGRDLRARDYGFILLQGGLGSRHQSGIRPRGWKGNNQVNGFIIEWDQTN